ncbi:MAG: hypothetical protein JW939_01015 [Candidatus Thermoplasmatota archaeon]|nr:hypothetical protein [Candidatus Thermoplasmatota archaeon]
MSTASKIDMERLDKNAKASQDGEGYMVLARGNGYRIGIVALVGRGSKISHTVEVLVRALDSDHEVDTTRMEQILKITRELTERDYSLSTENDGWIYAQRSIDPALVETELQFLMALVDTPGQTL